MFRQILEYVLARLCIGRNKKSSSSGFANGFDLILPPMYCLLDNQPKMNATEVRVVTLEDGQHLDSTHFRIEKGWTLVFRLGSSLFGRKVKLYSNFPSSGRCFARQTYELHSWDKPSASDDMLSCSLKIREPGSFHYYIECDNESEKRASGYLVVNPSLQCDSVSVPLNCIQCVTYLSKNLGKFSSWKKRLEVAEELGYNMIHFTPIQELGASQSAYSIADQLKVNSQFCDEEYPKIGMDDISEFTENLRVEWKMLSICDIVLNHTANESPWLQEHPECAYNMVNSPHLKAAYLLDIALHNFSSQVANGDWELKGVPKLIRNEENLQAIAHILRTIVLPEKKIEELFIVPIDTLVSDFLTKSLSHSPMSSVKNALQTDSVPELKIIQDPLYRRLKSTIDIDLALRVYNVFRGDCFQEEDRVKKCVQDFRACLEQLNQAVKDELRNHLDAAVGNVVASLRYMRLDPSGPCLGEVSDEHPLFVRYFTDYKNEALEDHAYSGDGAYIMTHNGWVMNADPLKNFADPDSQIYLRRELIAWGDSVKLRYGEEPEDCPYLWQHMREYVELTVRAFDGVRLDNCHSTPIHVAEYLLDCARLIKPDLYVVAELFTNSDRSDNLFVNRLGITSLIRESMSAWDSHELGRLVHRYGGEPVGAFSKPAVRPLIPSVAHALFLDLTHDNPSPIQKRTVFDLLPSSALVAMACCATGSSMGYDLLVPHQIDVVEEKRVYSEWGSHVDENNGIAAGKRALNELHYYLGANGYSQVFVDQINPDVVCVTRHNSVTHESIVLAAFTAFSNPNKFASGSDCRHVTVSGRVESILIEAYLAHESDDRYSMPTDFSEDESTINGLTEYELWMKTMANGEDAFMVRLEKASENETRVIFTDQFKPGSIIAMKFVQADESRKALRKAIEYPVLRKELLQQLSLADINRILYCCDGENGAVYHVPNSEPFVYCGLQGIISSMETVSVNNDLGHPICQNLRDGDWLMDYTVNRLKDYAGTNKLGHRVEELLNPIKSIPRYLVPCYFHLIISGVFTQIVEFTLSLMPRMVSDGSDFTKLLALGSVQFCGIVASSPLPPLSTKMHPPIPPVVAETRTPLCITLAAGLPHFAVGWVRNWGRDTFISLRGLLLLTGRFDEARYLILAYAGCLRHGLIPNLLDGGRSARYNCRDAVWWWLYTIQQYVSMVPGGEKILTDVVSRLYPIDDSPLSSLDQPLYDVMQEALNKHFQGLCFRERNAGVDVDAHMTNAGFDNQIGVHPVTGFVFGGNEWNCGTWMDKMGSSEKAGNRGKPATPRDGSAIEIVALCKSVVSWLAKMHESKFYPYDGVKRGSSNGSTTSWTYVEWANKIQNNFEKYFWIPAQLSADDLHPDLINRRQIYKDCHGATQAWSDYQLRCNYSVAMVIAPELFAPQNAWQALEVVNQVLVGPLGMKTLDPNDWNYNGTYDNADDSASPKTAHGFNYHQGPEWIWPVGYFLRARLYFALKLDDKRLTEKVLSESKSYLSHHLTHLKSSNWRGLPELTNKDGVYCPHSCPTQAWSMATILEAVHDIVKK